MLSHKEILQEFVEQFDQIDAFSYVLCGIIDGSAGSKDRYPLDSALTRINLHFFTLVLSFPIIAIIKLRKKRKSNL